MASPSDLVSLADPKSWLGIAGIDDDVLLARLITQISRAIFNVIDRPAILPSAYTETYDGGNDVSIMLRQWPVTGVSSCTVDGVAIPPSPPLAGGASAQIGYVLDSCDAAPPGAMQRLSLRGFLFTCGVQNVTISYGAGSRLRRKASSFPQRLPIASRGGLLMAIGQAMPASFIRMAFRSLPSRGLPPPGNTRS